MNTEGGTRTDVASPLFPAPVFMDPGLRRDDPGPLGHESGAIARDRGG
jgi:hypothetical protein